MREGSKTESLERDLCQVPAPDELWRRIGKPRYPRTRKRAALTPLAVLACATLAAVAVWGFFPRGTLSPQALAIQALTRAPETLELQSGTIPSGLTNSAGQFEILLSATGRLHPVGGDSGFAYGQAKPKVCPTKI